jgi:hypothetical protein
VPGSPAAIRSVATVGMNVTSPMAAHNQWPPSVAAIPPISIGAPTNNIITGCSGSIIHTVAPRRERLDPIDLYISPLPSIVARDDARGKRASRCASHRGRVIEG